MLVDALGKPADPRRYAIEHRASWYTGIDSAVDGPVWGEKHDAWLLEPKKLREFVVAWGPVFTLSMYKRVDAPPHFEPSLLIVVYEVTKTMHTCPEVWDGLGVTAAGTHVELDWRYRHNTLRVSTIPEHLMDDFVYKWPEGQWPRSWSDVRDATRQDPRNLLDIPEAIDER